MLSDVITMTPPTSAAVAPVMDMDAAQLAAVSQFEFKEIVCWLPLSTVTINGWFAPLVKSNTVKPPPVRVPALAATEKSYGVNESPVALPGVSTPPHETTAGVPLNPAAHKTPVTLNPVSWFSSTSILEPTS